MSSLCMTTVWQATDTQLNRQVGLKILPDAGADEQERNYRDPAAAGSSARPPASMPSMPTLPS